jgi:hypothetical protein
MLTVAVAAWCLLKGAVKVQCLPSLFCAIYRLGIWKSVFPPHKTCSHYAATCRWRSAVPFYWCSGVLTGFPHFFFFSALFPPPPKKKTQQVKIWWCERMSSQWMWQHCPSKICDGCLGAHTCVCPQRHGGATIQKLFWWVELSEGKHSEFLVFQLAVGVYCCPPRLQVHKNDTFFYLQDCNHECSNHLHPTVMTL